jgi:thymidylate synthase (FAD)
MIPKDGVDVFGDGTGFVRLVNHVGSELDVVNAARVSFHKEAEWKACPYDTDGDGDCGRHQCPYCGGDGSQQSLSDSDRGLLKFLLKNRHGTPFEQGFMSQWHIRAPIFVFREWHRHRIGISINEESGRYVELRKDFFSPDHLRVQTGRPGHYTYVPLEDWDVYEEFLDDLCLTNELQWEMYQKWLDRGIAKEQVRMFLGLNIYSEMRWTANARSLLNFFSLRSAENAQYEIRQYSLAMEKIFAQHMPTVHEAFIKAGRIAP